MIDGHGNARSGPSRQLRPGSAPDVGGPGDGADLKALLGRLNRDATQLMHDELELAKLELRDVADAFTADIQEAGQTLARDLAKIGVALSLGSLAGLALTAGAILVVGQLLGGAFWAGGLIVGGILLIAAGAFAASAARDMQSSEALRMQRARETLERDRDVLTTEARRTRDFAKDEASEFKREATPPERHRH